MYLLDKSSKKYECPRCGKRRLVLYLDHEGTGKPLDMTVGRCDREQECGYHYKPSDYFRDHPQKRTWKTYFKPLIQSVPNPSFIVPELVRKAKSMESDFCKFLATIFNTRVIEQAVDTYCLGATRNDPLLGNSKHVIFWQIDREGRCRAGKIMKYDQTGHRLKEGKDLVNWVHSRLKNTDYLSKDYKEHFTQCFFGEHLLNSKEYPGNADKPIAITESEKTAVICSMVYSQSVWLSVGGKENLRKILETEGDVLRDRDIILYPDAGCYDEWKEKSEPFRKAGLRISLSDLLEKFNAKSGSDIADFLLPILQAELDRRDEEPIEEFSEAREVEASKTIKIPIVEFVNHKAVPDGGYYEIDIADLPPNFREDDRILAYWDFENHPEQPLRITAMCKKP